MVTSDRRKKPSTWLGGHERRTPVGAARIQDDQPSPVPTVRQRELARTPGFDPVFPLYSQYLLLEVDEPNMPDIEFVRSEIEHIRSPVSRQRKEILQLQGAGLATASAEALRKNAGQDRRPLCPAG